MAIEVLIDNETLNYRRTAALDVDGEMYAVTAETERNGRYVIEVRKGCGPGPEARGFFSSGYVIHREFYACFQEAKTAFDGLLEVFEDVLAGIPETDLLKAENAALKAELKAFISGL